MSDGVSTTGVGGGAASSREQRSGSIDPAAATAGGVVFLDGEMLQRADARVSVDDRGFLFGDGAYEVTRAVDGRLFEAERHRERLERTLNGLAIETSTIDFAELDRIALALLEENGLLAGEATVYVQVTRGTAVPRTHHFPPAGTRPTVYLSVARFVPPAALRERGARVITVPDIRWARCDLKTVNLLPNALAKQQAVAAGADEALFVRDGVLMEGAHTNMFAVLDGVLRTAPRTNYILPGITRDVVLELALEERIPVREYPLLFEELPQIAEMFMTSTTSDVLPVVRVDARTIGDGRPGPVADRLYHALRRRMAG